MESTLRDIAISELRQLELDENYEFDYTNDTDISCYCNKDNLFNNSFN